MAGDDHQISANGTSTYNFTSQKFFTTEPVKLIHGGGAMGLKLVAVVNAPTRAAGLVTSALDFGTIMSTLLNYRTGEGALMPRSASSSNNSTGASTNALLNVKLLMGGVLLYQHVEFQDTEASAAPFPDVTQACLWVVSLASSYRESTETTCSRRPRWCFRFRVTAFCIGASAAVRAWSSGIWIMRSWLAVVPRTTNTDLISAYCSLGKPTGPA